MRMTDHIRLGEILAPFREERVAIIGSGFTTHQSSRDGSTPSWATDWGKYIHDIISNKTYTLEERKTKISSSTSHPAYRSAHPTSDHYIPLPVTMAAAGYTPGDVIYEEIVMGSLICSHVLFK